MSGQSVQVLTPGARNGPQRVEVIAQAVLATPGVQGLHAGKEHVVTYLPTRQVRGIREVEYGYDVHVVLARDCHLLLTVEAIRAAVQALAPGRVDVTVENVTARRRASSR
ncbi:MULTISPECIES: hypothetical protein [Allobranchiibius]|uniref:Asp23/Gls24 family envelope stress response protein n=1 Tax=Allobranchiibius huperziae TaxID=1874116 RepID=A0A853DAP0_9MICO|nr:MULTISPECIES: hypothetical protein [Allobranchiibius]MBO1768171.1 hypothetical protein [Allobranchiibius sp. GilTou38]NYJ74332.1 hypothetical protein [Allobranchiibius huperziae]UIJ34274.1 hypothetical protein LVQ62_14305 [Allobranchiibius sp. GilTou73]